MLVNDVGLAWSWSFFSQPSVLHRCLAPVCLAAAVVAVAWSWSVFSQFSVLHRCLTPACLAAAVVAAVTAERWKNLEQVMMGTHADLA